MKMKRGVLISCVLLLALASSGVAVPMYRAEHNVVPMRQYAPAQDTYVLSYYNFCSGWVYYWTGYCYQSWYCPNMTNPVQYGTVFDLADCPADCRHLTDIWWAVRHYDGRAMVDVEIFCAGMSGCPIGPALAGVYQYRPSFFSTWLHFTFNDLELCPCEYAGRGFVFLVTDYTAGGWTVPYSDVNVLNIAGACETEWRCGPGHSYVFNNLVNYCDIYGMPGALWVSGPGYGCTNFPLIPPGCHNYFYPTGFFTEFLVDAYVACLGPTATEKNTWSEVKGLYR
jgi:hypothetical protein